MKHPVIKLLEELEKAYRLTLESIDTTLEKETDKELRLVARGMKSGVEYCKGEVDKFLIKLKES